ncbi:MAG: hybrid sensor histidine kinase/response regulator, partial [Rhizorhabdus sp.]|nr:hybrid sensor histidine kinase/response regulator [Rhizorhabdus sp.]
EPFFTTKDVGKGTGLGLSMVYGFAQQSGGIATVESILGEGSCIRLYLPRAQAIIESDRPVRPIVAETGRRPLNILLVDDHPQVRAMTAAWLEDLGHKVVAANGASEAAQYLDPGADRIDLLMTDYAMPLISGTEMISRARASHPGLPVILLTGYADADKIGNRPDDIVLLGKPFRHEQLTAAIDSAVRPG